jgi:hypothetical protein
MHITIYYRIGKMRATGVKQFVVKILAIQTMVCRLALTNVDVGGVAS